MNQQTEYEIKLMRKISQALRVILYETKLKKNDEGITKNDRI